MALISVPTTPNEQATENCSISNESTFITANPDDKKSTVGVSLENVLSPNTSTSKPHNLNTSIPINIESILSDDFQQPEGYNWYFLRVSYNRAEKFYNELKDRNEGYLLWMPCSKVVKYEGGKKSEILVPIFKSNIFIYSTEEMALALTKRAKNPIYPYVDFAFDHTTGNGFGTDKYITIPFREMKNFIKAENVHHPWAHVVTDEQIVYRAGGYVRVTGGAFEGVIGRVARVFGQTRVVISIKGILKYATAYVSQKYLVPYTEPDHEDLAGHSHAKRVEESRKLQAAKIRKRIKKSSCK